MAEETNALAGGPLRTVIGPTLVLKGDLSAHENLVIRGRIHGSVVGSDTVLIKKTARLEGRISAARIELEQGVEFDKVVLAGHIAQNGKD